MSDQNTPAPAPPAPLDMGRLLGVPTTVRTLRNGQCLLLNQYGVGGWQGANHKTLLDDTHHVRLVLHAHGFALLDNNETVVPLPESAFAQPVLPPPLPSATEPVPAPPPVAAQATPQLPEPAIPAEYEALIQEMSQAVPAFDELAWQDDVLRVNRVAITWALWSWMLANREMVGLMLNPPPPKPARGRPAGKHNKSGRR